jgi:pimeloyl-ACP methyl ester carboxylesterase
MEKVVELIGRVGMEEWVAEHWSKNTPFAAESLARTPEILDEYRAMVLGNEPGAYTRTCLAIARTESLTGQLSQVVRPALVISGTADDRTLPEAGRELAAALADASYVELEGVGHTMPLEAPAQVSTAIRRFLASRDGGGPEAKGSA